MPISQPPSLFRWLCEKRETTMMEDTIVLYPSPGRGHLFCMVELGKQIVKHHPSISVTIIISTLPTEPFPVDDPYFSTLPTTYPSITLLHLPKVSLPPITSFSPLDFVASFFELPELSNTNLHQTLLNLSKSFNIKALIIDFFCSAAFEFVSSRHNIPIYFFFTSGASGLSAFLHLPVLDKIFTKSLKDLDVIIDLHGIFNIPSKAMPAAICDRSHKVYRYFLDTAKLMMKSAGIVINTSELLEHRALQAIQEGKCDPNEPVPPLFCVGPLVTTSESKSEHECLAWLDSQPSRSRYFLVDEMKVALALREAEGEQFVTAPELEECLIELMNSKKGEAVRERVLKLSEDAAAAKSDGGSSCVAMAKLLDSFKKG
ncbi:GLYCOSYLTRANSFERASE [Salix koriyanagi]|uniref:GLYCOSYLTRANSFERASE n=1 Tax=Salix koriyanagi TaxID=2511006 RepID=A0A9Q0PG68_9ROSI|nr:GLYCOSYLTRANSFERASE [Salix koriyanagi]